MDVLEASSHSFIVKVWLETTVAEAGRARWRGHITHVADDRRRYFQDLDDLPLCLAPYLAQMGVRLPLRWRVRQWLRRDVLSAHLARR